jgi:hypothetical protein
MLYRIKNPRIRKLALVKNPASGHRWHLLKSAPDEDAELERWADSLTRDEAAAAVEQIDHEQRLHARLDAIEAKLAKAEPVIRARRALAVLAKSAAPPEQQLAALVQREEIRERQERVLADMRNRPRHATSYMYNEPTASAATVADYVMRLKRAGGG